MTNLSDLFPTNTSPIKSVQTGLVNTSSASTGSGEDSKYVDITISSVNPAKCFVYFTGLYNNNANSTITSASSAIPTARLTSATNLRISNNTSGFSAFYGRYQVVEFN